MRLALKGLVVLGAVALLCGNARADINFNKRGTTEAEQKAFAKEVGEAIVKAARKCKDISLQKFQYKEPAAGRTDLVLSMGYKGVVTGKKYSADITVHLNSAAKDSWSVLDIDYDDNNANKTTIGKNKIKALVTEFNKAGK
jgi:phenylpyruvate tautomerase PptA (4-oxalocrotonate tautomerase family)